jgi:hypothetical protein
MDLSAFLATFDAHCIWGCMTGLLLLELSLGSGTV